MAPLYKPSMIYLDFTFMYFNDPNIAYSRDRYTCIRIKPDINNR